MDYEEIQEENEDIISKREKIDNILDVFTSSQLDYVIAILNSIGDMVIDTKYTATHEERKRSDEAFGRFLHNRMKNK